MENEQSAVTQTLDQPVEPRGGSVYGLSIVVRFDPVTQRKMPHHNARTEHGVAARAYNQPLGS